MKLKGSFNLVRPAAALAAVCLFAVPLAAQDGDVGEPELEVRVWLDRGDGAVLNRGDRVRIYYRTSEPAYLAIFHIDTDGVVHLLFPRAPEENSFVQGGRDYRLLLPRSPYWFVDEDEGKGYFFAVASIRPLDFSRFVYIPGQRTWDLSQVGRTVYEDPYVAMDDYVAALIPDWEEAPYALDFISYDVGSTHAYPRFLCYNCHGFRSYATWNPYTYACAAFRVVIWDDPYFYPAYRYGPTRVVFPARVRTLPRFEFKERRPGEAWSPLTRTRQPPTSGRIQYLEPGAARSSSGVRRGRMARPRAGATAAPGGRTMRPSRAGSSTAAPRRSAAPGGGAGARTSRPSVSRRPSDSRRPSAGGVRARTPTVRAPRRRASTPARRTTPVRGETRKVRPSGAAAPRSRTTGTVRAPARSRPEVRSPSRSKRPPARPSARAPATRRSRPVPSARPRPSRGATRPSVRSRPTVRKRPAVPKKRPGGKPRAPTRRKPGGGGA
ncbi:MAG: DUF4384 domain-containing protein [Gemmatimonadota bacterium]